MKLPDHLFVSSCDGALYDTRRPAWHSAAPLRPVYARHFTRIRDTHQLRATLRAGPCAWPGGYPLYFVTDDGHALAFNTVRDHYAQCARVINDGHDTGGWRVIACEVNYEDNTLTCEHTGAPIPAAYA